MLLLYHSLPCSLHLRFAFHYRADEYRHLVLTFFSSESILKLLGLCSPSARFGFSSSIRLNWNISTRVHFLSTDTAYHFFHFRSSERLMSGLARFYSHLNCTFLHCFISYTRTSCYSAALTIRFVVVSSLSIVFDIFLL